MEMLQLVSIVKTINCTVVVAIKYYQKHYHKKCDILIRKLTVVYQYDLKHALFMCNSFLNDEVIYVSGVLGIRKQTCVFCLGIG